MMNFMQLKGEKGAIFSDDRSRRFLLWRRVVENDALPWDEGHDAVLFIGLNPSIADEERLDPTVTRCYNYAKRWNYHYLLMGNLYSKVSTDPRGVDFETIDHENWDYLAEGVQMADMTIVAWGANANPKIAMEWQYLQTETLRCLGKNKNGSPKHPLYLRGDTQPEIFLTSARGRFNAGQWE